MSAALGDRPSISSRTADFRGFTSWCRGEPGCLRAISSAQSAIKIAKVLSSRKSILECGSCPQYLSVSQGMTGTPAILIVDDDSVSAKILHKVLAGMGRLHHAASGAAALEHLSEHPTDLILLDIVMPEIDGFATCRTLRQDHPDIPVVFITAMDDPVSEIQALELGGHDFIAKPINPAVVRARVALHLKLRAQDTAHRQIEEQLRVSEERHRLLADNAIDVIWTMDLEGRLTYVSPSVERLCGFTADEVIRQSRQEMRASDSLAIVQNYLRGLRANVRAGLPLENFRAELELPCQDGSTVWIDITASPLLRSDGNFVEILGVARDIGERKEFERALQQAHDELAAANAELRQIATTDPLTGARNRRHFEEAAKREMQRLQRFATPLSLLLFDLDHFKSINDRYGHPSGDRVLIEVTRRVQNNLRSLDLLARWGGEEFAVLIPHGGSSAALGLAEKLRALIADEPFPVVGTVTASFGVAALGADDTYDAWLKRVDGALYAAKSDGRNCVRQAP